MLIFQHFSYIQKQRYEKCSERELSRLQKLLFSQREIFLFSLTIFSLVCSSSSVSLKMIKLNIGCLEYEWEKCLPRHIALLNTKNLYYSLSNHSLEITRNAINYYPHLYSFLFKTVEFVVILFNAIYLMYCFSRLIFFVVFNIKLWLTILMINKMAFWKNLI